MNSRACWKGLCLKADMYDGGIISSIFGMGKASEEAIFLGFYYFLITLSLVSLFLFNTGSLWCSNKTFQF
jgi:hypothetical protein